MKAFLLSGPVCAFLTGAAASSLIFILLLRFIKKTEYSRGYSDGAESTLKDFQIQYQKFENIDEKFFSSTIETGYLMQLTYRGLPVGDITKRVIHSSRKVDKKRVDEIISRLNETVNSLVLAASAGKIPVKEVKDLLRKK